ncbi:MAG: hypothetical protein HYV66_02815 [Candidatus Sungbacteria bacterium]|uniref:Uncharacterized protein n=1 Tax=Candidatus Sungiibacteriota bacterium TaxID=2750080 RepID=A0A931YE10_9BACT|nr:hypothetical protein [Candidatus Sungbacteria bacterium]
MEVFCICREILLILDRRHSELELNTRIWPRLQTQGVNWAKMKEVLDQLVVAQLVAVHERRVECNRIALFYRISELGSQELKRITTPKGKKGLYANATSFCGEKNCCLNQAA